MILKKIPQWGGEDSTWASAAQKKSINIIQICKPRRSI
jgi:hypothetical protein